VNALIKPVLKLLSLPLIFLTLGLFTFVINALMLMLTAAFTDRLVVSGFGPALWGSIVISVVSFLLSTFVDDEKKD
jgi:putative membrane protein